MSKPTSGMTLASLAKPFRRRKICNCTSRFLLTQSTKTLSTSSKHHEQAELYGNRGRELRTERRWESTPPRMMAPVRSKPPVYDNDFVVNKDPAKLDSVYNKMLGKGGDEMLTDEVKWLAVTHKSFDHGRRGYNDRLAFLGRRIVELQTSLALIHGASADEITPVTDQDGREPFSHPALQGLDGLTENTKSLVTEKRRLSLLAERYGLDGVLRWKPKRMTSLQSSGLPIVMTQALYAIVGAVALQRGGEVANDVVREKILNPLGFH